MKGVGGGSGERGGGGEGGRGYPYSLVRLGSKAGSHNVTVVLQTPRPQQTRLMATVSSPDRERKRGRGTEVGVEVAERDRPFERLKRRWMKRKVKRKSENTLERGKNKVRKGETKKVRLRWTST